MPYESSDVSKTGILKSKHLIAGEMSTVNLSSTVNFASSVSGSAIAGVFESLESLVSDSYISGSDAQDTQVVVTEKTVYLREE